MQGEYSLSHLGRIILDAYKTQNQVLRTAFGSYNQSAFTIVKCRVSGFVYKEVKIAILRFFHALSHVSPVMQNEVTDEIAINEPLVMQN